MLQHVICILGILLIAVAFVFLVVIVEPLVLDDFPPQLPTYLEMDQWMDSFQLWALVCVGASAAASFLWYGFGQNVFKANNEKSYGKRGLWGVLFILPACAIIFSILFIEEAESGLWLAYLFFGVNGLSPYYVATVLFSPVSVKYTPIGGGIRSRFPY
ncbi:MAG: hypothetical protein OXI43_13335 [Candidatus Poribacteria bacterium]|nr:hypothetical protein [Candidatus Poribacteria bacterium]